MTFKLPAPTYQPMAGEYTGKDFKFSELFGSGAKKNQPALMAQKTQGPQNRPCVAGEKTMKDQFSHVLEKKKGNHQSFLARLKNDHGAGYEKWRGKKSPFSPATFSPLHRNHVAKAGKINPILKLAQPLSNIQAQSHLARSFLTGATSFHHGALAQGDQMAQRPIPVSLGGLKKQGVNEKSMINEYDKNPKNSKNQSPVAEKNIQKNSIKTTDHEKTGFFEKEKRSQNDQTEYAFSKELEEKVVKKTLDQKNLQQKGFYFHDDQFIQASLKGGRQKDFKKGNSLDIIESLSSQPMMRPHSLRDDFSQGKVDKNQLSSLSQSTQYVQMAIQKAMAHGKKNITLHMQPESLGRVSVHFSLTPSGEMKGKIRAENPKVLSLLKREYQEWTGLLKVRGFDVHQKSFEFESLPLMKNLFDEMDENQETKIQNYAFEDQDMQGDDMTLFQHLNIEL